jgi:hypothetical protein
MNTLKTTEAARKARRAGPRHYGYGGYGRRRW